jgi:hypothetical protein
MFLEIRQSPDMRSFEYDRRSVLSTYDPVLNMAARQYALSFTRSTPRVMESQTLVLRRIRLITIRKSKRFQAVHL